MSAMNIIENPGSALDMFVEEFETDRLISEELPPAVNLLATWACAACFGSASCPASTTSSAGSASCAG